MPKTHREDLATLAERFPPLFDSADPRPLAIDIRQQLVEKLGGADMTPGRVYRALAFHVRNPRYWSACAAPDSVRYNLDGSTAPLNNDHRESARLRLKAYLKRRRKAAKAARKRVNSRNGK